MASTTTREVHGTADAAGRGKTQAVEMPPVDPVKQDMVEHANALIRQGYEALLGAGVLTATMPVGKVQWIHISQVRANDWNPNAVAHQEMRLLYVSISEDGYTQPVVAMRDDETGFYVIVDGFHRYTTMRQFQDIADSTSGYLPVVVIDKPIADRIASTVRHNRARGKHSVAGMGSLVFQMLNQGETDVEICNKLGLEAEELARLKHITGYSKLFREQEYSRPALTDSQMRAKADYKKAHPDEPVPNDF